MVDPGADIDSLLRIIGLTAEQPTAEMSDAARIFDLASSICDDLYVVKSSANLIAALARRGLG